MDGDRRDIGGRRQLRIAHAQNLNRAIALAREAQECRIAREDDAIWPPLADFAHEGQAGSIGVPEPVRAAEGVPVGLIEYRATPAAVAADIGHARHAGRERQRLLDFGDIHAADFENGAGAEIHGMEHKALDLRLRFGCGAGHEAGADAKSARSEPQVETRRLDLTGADGSRRRNGAPLDKRRDGLRRKNA